MKLLLVSAAILINSSKEILLAQRPSHKIYSGYWEFPGGKIENGETPEQAIIRELKEELGIDISHDDLQPFSFASHSYKDFHLLMPIFLCRAWQGKLYNKEQQIIEWMELENLQKYPLLPADVPIINRLKHYFLNMQNNV